jgi:hypothetical protein
MPFFNETLQNLPSWDELEASIAEAARRDAALEGVASDEDGESESAVETIGKQAMPAEAPITVRRPHRRSTPAERRA